MKKQKIEQLVSLTAVSTALGTSANAEMVASNLPIGGLVTPTSPGTVNWDIDSDGTNDVNLNFTTAVSISNAFNSIFMEFLGDARVAGVSDSNGFNRFDKLSSGAKLGTAGDGLGFNQNAGSWNLGFSTYSSSLIYIGSNMNGWSLGDTGYFGFKFSSDGNTHYGWAEMTISVASLQATINQAWYNDTPGGAVTVGVTVPEPAENSVLDWVPSHSVLPAYAGCAR